MRARRVQDFDGLGRPAAVVESRGDLRCVSHVTPETARACLLDLLKNDRFFSELNVKLVEKRHRRTVCAGWRQFLYMIVRFAQPEVFLETGVFDGESSAVILQALLDNNEGVLVSVDLPATETIPDSTD